MDVLATFRFRGTFPGINKLVSPINFLLRTGMYRLEVPFEVDSPTTLKLLIFEQGGSSSSSLLTVKIPLDDSTSPSNLSAFSQMLAGRNGAFKKLKQSFPISILCVNDERIEFIHGHYSVSPQIVVPDNNEGNLFRECTFELRKKLTGISFVFDSITALLRSSQVAFTASLSGQSNRCLTIHVFHGDDMQVVFIFASALRATKPSQREKDEVSLLSYATSATNAPITFTCSDDQFVTARIYDPPTQLKRMQLAAYLQNFNL